MGDGTLPIWRAGFSAEEAVPAMEMRCMRLVTQEFGRQPDDTWCGVQHV